MLRVTNMSSAVLVVYLDSANDLPQMRAQSKPDPYVVLSVGKNIKQTSALKRTDAPVWEQGFTFLVANPANDTLQLRIVDQKTDKELGQLTYIMSSLLAKSDLQLVSQPFQLQKSGPTSKVTMSLALKVLKKSANHSTEPVVLGHDHDVPNIQRQASVQSQQSEILVPDLKSVKLADYPSEYVIAGVTSPIIEEMSTSAVEQLITSERAESKESNSAPLLRHRTLSTQSSMGSYSLGRIQIALHYSVERQRLSVTIHKIMLVYSIRTYLPTYLLMQKVGKKNSIREYFKFVLAIFH